MRDYWPTIAFIVACGVVFAVIAFMYPPARLTCPQHHCARGVPIALPDGRCVCDTRLEEPLP